MYSTISDIQKLIGEDELIKLSSDQETADNDIIERAISDADAEINSYLATRYLTPLISPIPTIIRKFSVDIAIYNLASRRDAENEIRTQRYKDSIKFLTNVSKGIVDIPAQSAAGETALESAQTNEVTISNPQRIFSRASLQGF